MSIVIHFLIRVLNFFILKILISISYDQLNFTKMYKNVFMIVSKLEYLKKIVDFNFKMYKE